MKFSECLKLAREKANISQKELAKKLNVPVQTIGRYESSDMQPRIGFVVDLCNVLNISLDEFMHFHPQKELYYTALVADTGYIPTFSPFNQVYIYNRLGCRITYSSKQELFDFIDEKIHLFKKNKREEFTSFLKASIDNEFATKNAKFMSFFLDDAINFLRSELEKDLSEKKRNEILSKLKELEEYTTEPEER